VEREYGGKSALTPSVFLVIITGAVRAATVSTHLFPIPESFPGASRKVKSNLHVQLAPTGLYRPVLYLQALRINPDGMLCVCSRCGPAWKVHTSSTEKFIVLTKYEYIPIDSRLVVFGYLYVFHHVSDSTESDKVLCLII
jgi:hypothetical protein